mgnify:CR=1 FL=1
MFEMFSKAVHAQFTEMSKGELFIVRVSDIFDEYLKAFPEGTNPIFRKQTVHSCQCCKQFVKTLGKTVAIQDGKLVTVWDNLDGVPEPYKTVSKHMSNLIKGCAIQSVFRSKELSYGTAHNFDKITRERHDHFWGKVAAKHYRKTKADEERGERDTTFQVFQRALNEFNPRHFVDVLDLIDSNGLYRGAEFRPAITQFQAFLSQYDAADKSPNFVWAKLYSPYAKFRSTAIGNLFVQLAEGKDFDDAVKSYEAMVAPANYKRPTSVITQKMVEQAVQTLTDLGLGASIYRRYAKLSDISINEVLFADNESESLMKHSLVKLLEPATRATTVDEAKALCITAADFVKDVLPKAKSLDVLVKNRHQSNFLSLTTALHDSAMNLFKWDNPFAWSYDGDVTDSVKERVKTAGGNVNAKLRVSLSWYNYDDLDLHATLPGGNHIYYGNKENILDVDMNAGRGVSRNPVENLAFNDLVDGSYVIYVHQYAQRETQDVGFAIELEYGGVIQQYSYNKVVKDKVPCLNFFIKNGKLEKVLESNYITAGNASQEKWGVKTENLVPVVAVLNSPNHWDGKRIGAKHLIFALKDCKNPNPTRGVYNEYLRGDLEEHRKVFEVLGNKTKCVPTDDQVSGIGFTNGRNDTVTVVVDGRRSYTLSF